MPAVDLPPADAAPPKLPDYDALQRQFHEAFRADLFRLLDGLPVRPGARVLDAPCGGGFYAARLAERVARTGGTVVAADVDAAYLAEAADRLRPFGNASTLKANVYRLPFAAGSFDVVLCAQSLISLGDPVAALSEFKRVLAPGGLVAVLEADEFHHVLLPWPVPVEVAVGEGMRRANERRFQDAGRTAPVRRLRAQLLAAGFSSVSRRTDAADYAAPFPPPVAAFVLAHGLHLRELLADALPDEVRPAFDVLTRPDSPDALFRRADVELTCLNVVVTARA